MKQSFIDKMDRAASITWIRYGHCAVDFAGLSERSSNNGNMASNILLFIGGWALIRRFEPLASREVNSYRCQSQIFM
ncbi:MAG: hypothetical protein R2911_15450 [Caldilineaceae bacterium]